jgi:hypothetical protein
MKKAFPYLLVLLFPFLAFSQNQQSVNGDELGNQFMNNAPVAVRIAPRTDPIQASNKVVYRRVPQMRNYQNPPIVQVNEQQNVAMQQAILADNNIGQALINEEQNTVNQAIEESSNPSVTIHMPQLKLPSVQFSSFSSSEAKKHESFQRILTRKLFNFKKKAHSVFPPKRKRSINRTACFSWAS